MVRTSGASRTSAGTEEHRAVRPASSRHAARRSRLERIAFVTRIAALGVAALIVLVVGAVQFAGRDSIRPGVHALGVDLSGMSRDEARAALDTAAAERMERPLVLIDGGSRWELSAAELGLTIDVAGALDDAWREGRTGFGPDRIALLWRLRDEPVEVAGDRIAVNGPLLDADLANLAAEIFREKIDPRLTLDTETGPSYVAAQTGRLLDVEATRAAILSALAGGDSRIALPIVESEPAAYDEDYADARRRLDNLWDAPIEVVAVDEVWTLTSDQLSYWIEIQPATGPGRPATITTNETWIDDVVTEIATFTNRAPRSARVWWDVSGNLIKTYDGDPGRRLQWDESRALVHAAFLGDNPANRIDLPVAIENPPALPEDLNTLGIQSHIAEASTSYGGGLPERMHNIELAATLLNGAIVLPGQTFSFNGEMGPTTTDAGFQIAYGIAEEDGEFRTIPSEAGGICQVATTVFQPVFWLGYQINERSTHSFWIPNYTYRGYVGLDAAVDEGTGLDLKWTNTTETAVLIEAEADGQNFTVRLYGTAPDWTVQIDEPKIENIVAADDDLVYEATKDLPDGHQRQIERANDGFDVTITRHVTEDGQTRTEHFSTSYGPSRNVVLVGSSTGELPAQYRNP